MPLVSPFKISYQVELGLFWLEIYIMGREAAKYKLYGTIAHKLIYHFKDIGELGHCEMGALTDVLVICICTHDIAI